MFKIEKKTKERITGFCFLNFSKYDADNTAREKETRSKNREGTRKIENGGMEKITCNGDSTPSASRMDIKATMENIVMFGFLTFLKTLPKMIASESIKGIM